MEPVKNLFVLEGSDGTGKSTQIKLLTERLRQQGYGVVLFSFPRYSELSSHFIKSYLAGHYGDSEAVGPYAASLFYALDRYEAMPSIKAALAAGKIVLIDRYTASNLAHQGSKLSNAADRRGFYLWLDSLEHQILQLPRPTHSFVLYAPPATTKQLLEKRHEEDDSQPDIHEADLPHLTAASAAYDELCALFPQDFERIDCVRNNQLLSKTEISDLLWNRLEPLLPSPESTTVQPYSLPHSQTKTQRPIQQSGGIILQLHKVSKLAVTELEVQGLVKSSTLSEPTEAYMPPIADGKLVNMYTETLQNTIARFLKHAPESADFHDTLPLATLYDAEISGSVTELKQAIVELVANQLPEFQDVGQKLFEQLYALQGTDLTKQLLTIPLETVQSRRLNRKKSRDIADQYDGGFGTTQKEFTLIRATPQNETDILPQLLYSESNSTLTEISEAVSKMSYQAKSQHLTSLLDGASLQVLRHMQYDFELLAKLPDIIGLRNHFGTDISIRLQPITPRYGFDTPDTITSDEASEAFESSFDDSLVLSSHLQATAPEFSAYAALAGNRVRAYATLTAASKHHFASKGNCSNKLCQQLRELLVSRHPLVFS